MEKNYRELLVRSLSSIGIVVFMMSFIYSRNIFYAFSVVVILSILMAMEWNEITGKVEKDAKTKWVFGGVIYIVSIFLPLLCIKLHRGGNNLLMWLFLLVWCEDAFAYCIGGLLGLGKHKISPISPKKSYEGLLGGMLIATVVCDVFAKRFLPEYRLLLLCLAPIFCCLEQVGDFTESYLKRKFNVKDSGNIIPGHGGIMDRFDGFLYLSISLLYLLHFF